MGRTVSSAMTVSSGTPGKNVPSSDTDVLSELNKEYSFLRDPLLGKAIIEIADNRRTIMKLKEENQILVETLRDLHMKIEYEKK
jgi:hypothetical protein